jgi:hypothetical protein
MFTVELTVECFFYELPSIKPIKTAVRVTSPATTVRQLPWNISCTHHPAIKD